MTDLEGYEFQYYFADLKVYRKGNHWVVMDGKRLVTEYDFPEEKK